MKFERIPAARVENRRRWANSLHALIQWGLLRWNLVSKQSSSSHIVFLSSYFHSILFPSSSLPFSSFVLIFLPFIFPQDEERPVKQITRTYHSVLDLIHIRCDESLHPEKSSWMRQWQTKKMIEKEKTKKDEKEEDSWLNSLTGCNPWPEILRCDGISFLVNFLLPSSSVLILISLSFSSILLCFSPSHSTKTAERKRLFFLLDEIAILHFFTLSVCSSRFCLKGERKEIRRKNESRNQLDFLHNKSPSIDWPECSRPWIASEIYRHESMSFSYPSHSYVWNIST